MKHDYPCIEINLGKITQNTKKISELCKLKRIEIMGVSKVFCAKKPIVKAMIKGGASAIGDSRIENLIKIKDIKCTKVLLRIPMESQALDAVKYSDISLNSEIETIEALSKAAKHLNKVHNVILMVDLGDLREGVLEADVFSSIEKILDLSNINLIGIGTNLTCYGGVIPDEANLGKLVSIKNSICDRFKIDIEIVSGGNSSSLYMVLKDIMPIGINQLRIGEAIVLGKETSYGERVLDTFDDAFILKGEIIEIKNKPSIPSGTIGRDAFGREPHFVDNGIIKRAIIAIGRQDAAIEGIYPIDKEISILGGSSDHLILDISKCREIYKVGDIVEFKMNYGCLLVAMTSPYVKKYYND